MFKFSLESFGAFPIFDSLVHVSAFVLNFQGYLYRYYGSKFITIPIFFYLANDQAEHQGPWASCLRNWPQVIQKKRVGVERFRLRSLYLPEYSLRLDRSQIQETGLLCTEWSILARCEKDNRATSQYTPYYSKVVLAISRLW